MRIGIKKIKQWSIVRPRVQHKHLRMLVEWQERLRDGIGSMEAKSKLATRDRIAIRGKNRMIRRVHIEMACIASMYSEEEWIEMLSEDGQDLLDLLNFTELMEYYRINIFPVLQLKVDKK